MKEDNEFPNGFSGATDRSEQESYRPDPVEAIDNPGPDDCKVCGLHFSGCICPDDDLHNVLERPTPCQE